MKSILLILLVCASSTVFSQATWTWLQGDAFSRGSARYGQKGVADSLSGPGTRSGEKTWVDKSGDTWVFGGVGYNDVWKYSKTSGKWTWMNGSKYPTDLPSFGRAGVTSPSNRIDSRSYAAAWVDANDDLWVFGGQRDQYCAYFAQLIEATNSLWRYSTSTNQWTWMNGDTSSRLTPTVTYKGNYTRKGIASPYTKPPAKHHAMNWIDKTGDLWLFGGNEAGRVNNASYGYNASSQGDLWKYSPASGFWTWISGDSTTADFPNSSYGIKGQASATNTPGKRTAGTTWVDAEGNLWLFGGYGNPASGRIEGDFTPAAKGLLNDLWKFSPVSNQWTWVGGDTTVNVQGRYRASQPWPGGRTESTSWTDKQGDLWMRSGSAISTTSYNDVWKYSINNNEWTWVGGDSLTRTYQPVPIEKNVYSREFSPGPEPATVTLKDTDNLLFRTRAEQLWNYHKPTDRWALIQGEVFAPVSSADIAVGNIGIVDSAGIPKTRQFAATWRDFDKNLWMFGGQRLDQSNIPLYDLWKYDVAQKKWIFMKGGEGNATAVYGTPGQPSDSARPAQRTGAYSFVDQSGLLWLFGGRLGQAMTYHNDLWSYNTLTNQWTYYGGNNSGSVSTNVSVYTATPTQPAWPGGRSNGNSWTDAAGNFWVYGGEAGVNNNGWRFIASELWMFNPRTKIWTFVSGDKLFTNPIFPQVGRVNSTSWTDPSGTTWLFGGGIKNPTFDAIELDESYTNTLLKITSAAPTFTVVKDGGINTRGYYGTKGVPSSNSMPRARKNGLGWTDAAGNLYLFGGSRDTVRPCNLRNTEVFNDLWKYTVATNQWTWLGGDSVGNRLGEYGTFGVPSVQNEPGGRYGSATWGDGNGNAFIFSGYGYAESGRRALNDMLLFNALSESALPVNYGSFTATRREQSALLDWTTETEQNSRAFIVEHSLDGTNFYPIGTVAASGNSTQRVKYSYRHSSPSTGSNYYRLKQVDFDNNFIYSKIAKLNFAEAKSQFSVLANPVRDLLTVTLDLIKAETVHLRIIDVYGKVITTQSYQGLKGNNRLDIPVSKLAGGNYILNVQSKSISSAKAFVKL